VGGAVGSVAGDGKNANDSCAEHGCSAKNPEGSALLVDQRDCLALRHNRSFHRERLDDKKNLSTDHVIWAACERPRSAAHSMARVGAATTRLGTVRHLGIACHRLAGSRAGTTRSPRTSRSTGDEVENRAT
jgi:hypothetical protein